MTIAIACDHGGVELKNYLIDFLKLKGFQVMDLGTNSTESVDYPDFAFKACNQVVEGKAKYAVLICKTGSGMVISANKVKGILAVNCLTTEMALLARKHNNANSLCLGAGLISKEKAKEIVLSFLSTDFEAGRHERRINKIKKIEESELNH
ncbi:MAG: ribose 5-phosphate isomerase B [archaeon]